MDVLLWVNSPGGTYLKHMNPTHTRNFVYYICDKKEHSSICAQRKSGLIITNHCVMLFDHNEMCCGYFHYKYRSDGLFI